MGVKIGSNNIGDVYVGSDKIGQIFVGSDLVYTASTPLEQQDLILNVQRQTRDTYVDSSTTYTNDSYIALSVGAVGGTASITYSGVTKTVAAGTTSTIRFGKYKGDDDGTATSGQLTIHIDSGCYYTVGAVTESTAKLSSSAVKCITNIAQWFCFSNRLGNIVCNNMFREQTLMPSNISIPEYITSIGDYAFYSCTNITRIQLSDNITSIGSSAFQGCIALGSVTLPSKLITINDYAFSNVPLSSITLPSTLETIGSSAFGGSNTISSVTLPVSLTSISYSAFSNLTTILVDANNPNFSSENGILFNKNKTILVQYPKYKTGTSYTIPNSVTSLGDGCFYYNEYLETVNINSSITRIPDYAFYYSKITHIQIPATIGVIGGSYGYAFSNCTNLTIVQFMHPTINNILLSLGGSAFKNGNSNVQYQFVAPESDVTSWTYWTTTYFTNTTYHAYTP